MQQKQCKPTMFKQDFNEEDHNSRYFWYIAGVFLIESAAIVRRLLTE
ncbi:hypothetical protein JCM19235_7049 [Vibrio maritimus]|uniref:Uncharacterized protein n=3 Tax=Vibrio TaxID=662 RepID=A0A090S9C0_9VIBR|nr:hypothetical protein JCM19235_7049 [Vibrio maritimus]